MNRKKIAEALRQLADALVDDSLEITDGFEVFKDTVDARCEGTNHQVNCMRRKHADDMHAFRDPHGAWHPIIDAVVPVYRRGACKHCGASAELRDGYAQMHNGPACEAFWKDPGLT